MGSRETRGAIEATSLLYPLPHWHRPFTRSPGHDLENEARWASWRDVTTAGWLDKSCVTPLGLPRCPDGRILGRLASQVDFAAWLTAPPDWQNPSTRLSADGYNGQAMHVLIKTLPTAYGSRRKVAGALGGRLGPAAV
jgi:hypothetical protein